MSCLHIWVCNKPFIFFAMKGDLPKYFDVGNRLKKVWSQNLFTLMIYQTAKIFNMMISVRRMVEDLAIVLNDSPCKIMIGMVYIIGFYLS